MENNAGTRKEAGSLTRAMIVIILLVFAFFGGYSFDINECEELERDNSTLQNQVDSLEIHIFDITTNTEVNDQE